MDKNKLLSDLANSEIFLITEHAIKQEIRNNVVFMPSNNRSEAIDNIMINKIVVKTRLLEIFVGHFFFSVKCILTSLK
ncbi:hypothetical protein [Winogradskyella sp.]|uniref:hypothetical protein n=1 Tax=Winogradskyella sp. TaxID=1883156 RepID=UPI003511FA53